MAMWPSIFTNFLRVTGRFIGTRIELTDALYLGDAETNGSLRINKDGTDFKVERRESGSWVEKIKVGETAGYAVLTKGVQSIAGAKTFTDAATFRV